MSFKLLAIRPLKGCSDNVRKNLQEDEFYFFDNSYKQSKDGNYIVKKEDVTDLPNGFFLQKNTESSLKYINVQAIVGKNGSGKSAIVELLIRVLNNTSKFIFHSKKGLLDLLYVNGLKAEVYFLKGGEVFKLKLDFEFVSSEEREDPDTGLIEVYDFDDDELYEMLKGKSCLKVFKNGGEKEIEVEDFAMDFFTMYVNYSLYGLDEDDYMDEGNEDYLPKGKPKNIRYTQSWLSKVFHKNDGYQTPLVIHPYREDAMINVRNEKHLMKNRLAVLLFTNPEYRTIIPDYKFETVGFYLKEFSFNKIVNDILDQNFLKKTGEEFTNLSDISKFDKFSINDIDTLVNYLAKWIEQNETLLSQVESINKFRNNRKVSKDIRSFGKFLYAIRGIFLDPIKTLNNIVPSHSEYETKETSIARIFNHVMTPMVTMQSLRDNISKQGGITDGRIDKIEEKLGHFNIDVISSLLHLSFSRDVLLDHYGMRDGDISYEENIKRTEIKDYLFWYCVVKVFKVCKYSHYSQYADFFSLNNFFKTDENIIRNKYREYFEKLSNDKSHITDKFRRTNFLLSTYSESNSNKQIIDLLNLYSNIYKENKASLGKEVVESIDDIGEIVLDVHVNNSDEFAELSDLLPPPIFDYEFYSKKDNVPFSAVSSGQFQKIGLLSSLVYHLKNLDSIQESTDIYSYENVNLILDEIELYFHPEQQRTFVSDLLGLLKKNKFKQIKRINIMFITHSPFILSDVPSQNVLKLREGKPEAGDNINSFGANIHDLLADEFFLDNGFMGEFAKEKINSIVKFLYLKKSVNELDSNMSNTFFSETMQETFKEAKEKLSKELDVLDVKYSKEEVEQYIKLIGEPLLAVKMKEMSDIAFKEN